MTSYQQHYQQFLQQPQAFWRQQAEQIKWFKFPEEILSKNSEQQDCWFADGELNNCYLALDAHVNNGRAEQVAIYYDSPVTATQQQYTYAEVLDEVSRLAGFLQSRGLSKGDTVIIYMPMIPQAVFAMLACARLGLIHSVVFGGFAAHELASRIESSQAKIILTASCGIEPNKTIAYKPIVDDALSQIQHAVKDIVVYQRKELKADLNGANEYDWQQVVSHAQAADCVSVKGSDPLYILYTSGSTGKPKGVVRDNAGYAVALNYSMQALYGLKPGDVFWTASDVGWVVGHSYIVYAPLIYGCSTVLYEGKPVGTPDASAFWRVIEQYKVKAFFSAPTAFRAIKKQDSEAKLSSRFDLSSLAAIYVAGERLDPATFTWLKEHFPVPVIDHWWQTETGWAIAGNPRGIELMPAKAGSTGLAMPGYRIDILDQDGNILERGEQGYIALKLPLAPGCLLGLWQDNARFQEEYLQQFPGYYVSGDGGYIDEDGYIFVMGRTDDVINIAGHRLSSGRMEELIATHSSVAECAVVGVNDGLKGQLPLAFVILKNGETISEEELNSVLKQRLRAEIGAINCMKHVYIAEQLPKTRSGKILRKTLRQIANGESFTIPSTIDDAASIDHIRQLLA